VASTPSKYQPSEEELASMDLFGGPIVTPRITPGTDFKSDTGNVLALIVAATALLQQQHCCSSSTEEE
jgi:hypothetical protein